MLINYEYVAEDILKPAKNIYSEGHYLKWVLDNTGNENNVKYSLNLNFESKIPMLDLKVSPKYYFVFSN